MLSSTLTLGLERLTAKFSWLSGQVVCEGQSEGNTGLFKIKSLSDLPRLLVKDLRQDSLAPTMHGLRESNFPMALLDESIFAPRRTFHNATSTGEGKPPSPVFLLQATILRDGLVITFLGQHQAMDITGQAQIMSLLSKACRNESFTHEEMQSGNLERLKVIPILEDYTQGAELARHLVKRMSPSAIIETGPSKCDWASIVFSPTSLAALKSSAVETRSPRSRYVSTDDALSALVWQSIMRARSTRLPPTKQVTFARAVDARRYVGITDLYPGIVQNMTYTSHKLQELLVMPLGEIASELRVLLEPETTALSFHMRALATYLHSQADKSRVSPISSLDLSIDVTISSWAKTMCYWFDFNLGLGPPEAVRRPRFTPLEGFVYFLPRARDGEIAIAICLREDDMERLRRDENFAKYARYDG